MLAKHLMNSGAARVYVEDVFNTYLVNGNNSTQTITTGVDLATYGGTIHGKRRSSSADHILVNTTRGATKCLYTNSTTDETSAGTPDITGFTSSGFTLGWNGGQVNSSSTTNVFWTYRNAPKFYTHSTKSHTNGVASTVDLSTLGAVGMVRVKRTDSTGSWLVWHRSLTAGNLLIGETTAAQAANTSISVSGTTLTIASAMVTGTYLVEAWAHDTSADGLIQCGSFTTDGSGNATVTLGWEPQFVKWKASSSTSGWGINDSTRGMPVGSADARLLANTADAETNSADNCDPLATGFIAKNLAASTTYIYLAIRRGPMKLPTSGTQVYQAIARTGTGAAATVTGVGFPPDLHIVQERSASGWEPHFNDRLRGVPNFLVPSSTAAEATTSTGVISSFDMDGITIAAGNARENASASTYINWFFRRYPGVLDSFADTGTGSNKTETHGLTVAPKFWIRKSRSGATQWVFGSTLLAATEKIVSPSPAGKVTDATAWNSTYPTATAFSVGTAAAVNTSSATYITYLVGELAGISKVFGYTGNGSNQTIDCGFAAGARFVLIVRTDTTGSFWIFDTVRGLIAGNDPALALDTTAAEVTTVDALDPAASGFIVNQEATFNLNVNTATYIGFALS
jgi:hypothetical protein